MTNSGDFLESKHAYDEGYRACPCFWGRQPGSLVRELVQVTNVSGKKILDLGSGEGKNAAFLARLGAEVEAWESSRYALRNSRTAWPNSTVRWREKDALTLDKDSRFFEVIIAYGLLHCMKEIDIHRIIEAMQKRTAAGGYNIVVAFNNRSQDIALAHPGFSPTLLPHDVYLESYTRWKTILASDEDLHEVHPHNGIPHTHSMTRLLLQNA
jgi:SAM-dependent methyltransferase